MGTSICYVFNINNKLFDYSIVKLFTNIIGHEGSIRKLEAPVGSFHFLCPPGISISRKKWKLPGIINKIHKIPIFQSSIFQFSFSHGTSGKPSEMKQWINTINHINPCSLPVKLLSLCIF